MADSPPLLLRIADAGQPIQKTLPRVHHPEVDAQVPAEGLLHLIALVQPQQAVIHEDAGKPVAHRTMDQDRGN